MKTYGNAQIKDDIKKVNPDVLVNRGIAQESPDGKIICPFCGNGNHDNGTGVSVKQDAYGNWRGHCFACGKTFDNLSLIAEHFHYDIKSDFPKILAEGATLLGASADFGDFKFNHKSSAKNFVKRQQDKKSDETPTDYSKFLQVARNNLINLPSAIYRGLDAKTMVHFGFGYAVNWKHPDIKNAPPSDRLIIPTSNYHYLARAIDDSVPKEYRKQHVGHKEIFNIDALKTDSTVIVVEGELDCASIWKVSDGLVPTIAVSGCTGYKLLLKWLEKNPDCNCSFIVVFDNDSGEKNSGQNAAKKFVDELNALGFPAVNRLLSERQDFDANDFLQENSDALRDRIFELYDEGSAELEKVYADVLAEKAFNKKVEDFESANGQIPDGVLDEIKVAVDKLSALTAKNFDANLLTKESFKRQLGLCNFYSFANSALGYFWNAFTKKKKFVKASIASDLELDDCDRLIQNFSESDVRKIIKTATKLVEAKHIEFNKEQQRRQREQYRQQKQAEEEQFKDDCLAQLRYLKSQPQTDERDAEIRALILSLCEWQKDKHGNELFVKPIARNFKLIFTFDPVVDGLFGYDDFGKVIAFKKEPVWTTKNSSLRIGESLQEIDADILANYISETYGDIPCRTNFKRQISELATVNTFHPVKDYFANLPKWDGVPRAERIFIDFLNADDTPYTHEVTFKSLLAAMVRVHNPGAEWQCMPILRGAQGIGKSHVLKMLGGKWYTELFDSVSDSHSMDAIEGALIVEMSELDAFHGSRANTIKAFISRSDDKRRKAYAIAKSSNKRTCVFFGTSNDSQLLTDITGNRRFPIIKCNSEYNQVKYGLSDDYISQLWAELYSKYQKMKAEDNGSFNVARLRFSPETSRQIEEFARDCVSDDGLIGEIRAFLDTAIPYKPVWRLLSREERKRFFANGGFITLCEEDLQRRQIARRRSEESQELQDIFTLADTGDYSVVRNPDGFLTFYGAVLRDTICASEVYNECFYTSDRRISIFKIAEILASELSKDGWFRERKKNTIYGDQRNTYVRVVTDDDEETPAVETKQADSVTEVDIDNNAEEQAVEDTHFDCEEFVTLTSSSNYADYDEEEFLTDDELRQQFLDDE